MSLVIEPSDLLTFQRPLTNVTKETLLVRNPSAEPVIFKVKTTAPRQYCVRPNAGRIDGNSQVEVQVILQPFKEEPPLDIKCKDKFLVQSAQIQAHEYGSTPVTEIWSRIEKENQGSIHQHKIKCSFASPPAQENDAATEVHLPPYIEVDNNAPINNDITSSSETKEDSTSAHSSNSDTIGSASLPEAEKATKTNDSVTETIKEQPSVTVATMEQPVSAPQPIQTDKEPETATLTTTQSPRNVSSSTKDHQPTTVPLAVDHVDGKKQVITESATTKSNDDENHQLRQELVAAQKQIIRLEHELEQKKQDLEGLRLRQNATITTAGTNIGAGTRKLPSTVQPLDAVHQHLAQLQKPHPVEGYPPNVVFAMCGVVFLFTYLFL